MNWKRANHEPTHASEWGVKLASLAVLADEQPSNERFPGNNVLSGSPMLDEHLGHVADRVKRDGCSVHD